jgi:hypothetical protein
LVFLGAKKGKKKKKNHSTQRSNEPFASTTRVIGFAMAFTYHPPFSSAHLHIIHPILAHQSFPSFSPFIFSFFMNNK